MGHWFARMAGAPRLELATSLTDIIRRFRQSLLDRARALALSAYRRNDAPLLASGGNKLQYNLYTTRAHRTVWADGTAGSQIRAGRGRGPARPVSLIVYGMLPDNAANQAAVAGIYSDTILVTVTY